jgi:hypothetical protein
VNPDRAEQVEQVLAGLVARQEEPLSSLADCLRSAAGSVDPTADPHGRSAAERISTLVETYIAASGGPGPLVEALQQIDIALAGAGVAVGPWATRFGALVAERFSHALQERWEAEQQQLLAERSPVFSGEDGCLSAAPVGGLGSEGQVRFCDRVLAAANRAQPRVVCLWLEFFTPGPEAEKHWEDLAAELATHGIRLERR